MNEVNNQVFRDGVEQIISDLTRIKKVADLNDCKVIVVSVPHKLSISKHDIEHAREKMAMQMPFVNLHENTSDSAYSSACEQVGLDFYQFTSKFIRIFDTIDLYYKVDGHFNKTGNVVFSNYVSEMMIDEINSISQ